MKTLKLIRLEKTLGGTWGVIYGEGIFLFTMELPWKGNSIGESCIPVGSYIVDRDYTGKSKYYAIKNVKGRSAIEFHSANTVKELKGCIAVGMEISTIENERVLMRSSTAIKVMLDCLKNDSWKLTIGDDYGNA